LWKQQRQKLLKLLLILQFSAIETAKINSGQMIFILVKNYNMLVVNAWYKIVQPT